MRRLKRHEAHNHCAYSGSKRSRLSLFASFVSRSAYQHRWNLIDVRSFDDNPFSGFFVDDRERNALRHAAPRGYAISLAADRLGLHAILTHQLGLCDYEANCQHAIQRPRCLVNTDSIRGGRQRHLRLSLMQSRRAFDGAFSPASRPRQAVARSGQLIPAEVDEIHDASVRKRLSIRR
jgi:hypothetical protein